MPRRRSLGPRTAPGTSFARSTILICALAQTDLSDVAQAVIGELLGRGARRHCRRGRRSSSSPTTLPVRSARPRSGSRERRPRSARRADFARRHPAARPRDSRARRSGCARSCGRRQHRGFRRRRRRDRLRSVRRSDRRFHPSPRGSGSRGELFGFGRGPRHDQGRRGDRAVGECRQSCGGERRARQAGAFGIGLLRTEMMFLDRETAPGEEEQAAKLREIFAVFAGRPIIVRTLDAGGDKPIPYMNMPKEANPFSAFAACACRCGRWRCSRRNCAPSYAPARVTMCDHAADGHGT